MKPVRSVITAGLAGILALSSLGCEKTKKHTLPNGKEVVLNYGSVTLENSRPFFYSNNRRVLTDYIPDWELQTGAYIEGVIEYIGTASSVNLIDAETFSQRDSSVSAIDEKNITPTNSGIVILLKPTNGSKERVLNIENADNTQLCNFLLNYLKVGDKIGAPTIRQVDGKRQFVELNPIDVYFPHEIRKR